MACVRQTKTNGAKSELFETIYDNLANKDEYEAEKLYSYFLNTDEVEENGKVSDSFVKEFGNYVKNKNTENFVDRIDENGEPKLFYNELAKKYYYVNENKEQIFFPLVKRGLRGVFEYKQIESIVSQLALSYFKENTSVNFNNIEFDENEKLPNLKGFIYNKLVDKIKESEAKDETYMNALLLEDTLEFLDEWVEGVDVFYKRIGIKRVDTEGELEGDIEVISNETKDPNFNKASFERDTKDAVSTNTKLKLSLLTYSKDDVKNTDIIWGESMFVPFDDVYSTLLFSLADQVPITKNGIIEDIWESYLNKINEVSNKKPYLKQLLDNLSKQEFTENNKNEFVQAFRLHKNNFLITELQSNFKYKEQIDNLDGTFKEVTTNALKVTVKNVSDSGSKASRLLSDWGVSFKNKFLNVDNSFKSDSKLKLQKINKDLLDLQQSIKNEGTSEDLVKLVNSYVSIADSLGVDITGDGLMHYLENVEDIFSTSKKLSTLSTAITDTILAVDAAMVQSSSKKVIEESKFENPLLTQSVFKNIANAEAFFMSEGGDSSINTGGKSKWLMSYPSYLSTKVLEWKKDPSILKGLYDSSANNRSSYLVKWLLGEENPDIIDTESLSKKRLNNFEIGNFSALQEVQGDSSSSSGLSKTDYFIDHVNKVVENGFIRTITPADKTTDMQIKTGLRIDSFEGFINNQVMFSRQTMDIMFGYFNGEINRSKEAHDEIKAFKNNPEKLIIHYHFKANKDLYDKSGNIIYANLGNAFKSQLFEELSYKSGSKNPLVIQIQELLYDSNGMIKDFQGRDLSENPVGRIGNTEYRIKDLIEQYIAKNLSEGVIKVGTLFREKGIFEVNKNGKTINKLISKEVYDRYKFNPALAVVADFHINSLIQNIEYTKMFTGDPAFYKNMIDFKKRVPATYTDGLQLRLKPGEETFNSATVSSIEIASPFIKELKKLIGDSSGKKYENINSADGQAWITPQRWEFLTKRLGKWTDTHDSLYAKMLSSESQKYTLEELKIAAQPLKGVYFDINGKTPTYLKYSQTVLTKNLITDSDLQKIYDKMTKDENGNELDYNDQVHEVITIDGFKVGSSTPTTIHNEDGSVKDIFEFNIQSLSNTGWKLQQDLPTKTFKDTEVGSQIQKNIFAGLKFNTNLDFDFQAKTITGQELIDEITDVTGKLSNIGMKSLMKEFGINKSGKIGNIRGFYNSLISELEKRGGSQNVIDALKKETVLYGVPQAVSKIVNVFMSITTKRLIKIKTNGGSFIQMSNFGLNKNEANQKGVKWAPDALSTTNEPIEYVDKEGKVKIRPGGILLSGSFIAKYIPNYREISAEELFGYTNEEGIFIRGKIDNRILESIVGYRIPNQGLASNDAFKIVGILPEENGDTIVAYTGITTKTGSDFDIDKMYLMMPSFSYNKESDTLNYITDETTKEGLQNKLIQAYKSVLTSPHNIKSIMSPIDNDIFKNDINDLKPATSKENLFHFNSINDIDLLYDFRGGKAGVGQEANAVVDINRLGKLYLKNTNIGWGHVNENNETEFDRENSKELSEKDLNYYVENIEGYYKKEGIEYNREQLKKDLKFLKIGDSLTAVLNGFVDISKDPFITRGNWTTSTTNTANLLLRSGMHPLYVSAFMAQPIISDYVEFQSSRESILGDNIGSIKEKFLEERMEKILKINPEFVKTEELPETLSLEKLRNEIKKDYDHNTQLNILDKFLELQRLSKQIKYNVDLSKIDTEAGGKNISTLFSKANLRKFLKDNESKGSTGTLMGVESKFDDTVLSKYYNNGIAWVINLVRSNPKLFPQAQNQVQDMFNQVSYDLYNTPAIDEDTMSDLESEYYNYAMSNFFDLTKEESIDLINKLPSEFNTFRKENRGKYFMIDELTITEGNPRIQQFIQLGNRKKSQDFDKNFVDSWKDLMIDNPEFAEKLIKYSFITSGFKISASQFYTFIPSEYMAKKGINNFIKDFVGKPQDDFIEKFYLNNYDNAKYVPNMFESKVEAATTTNKMPDYSTGFTLIEPGKARKYVKLVTKGSLTKKGIKTGLIYKLQGYTVDEQAIYVKVNALGLTVNSNKISEYGNQYTDGMFAGRRDFKTDTFDKNYLLNQIVFDVNTLSFNLETEIQEVETVETMFVEPIIKPENKVVKKESKDSSEITLNKEQQNAVDASVDFIKNGDPNQFFVIEGKAGTGKTTIAEKIIKEFPNKNTVVSALSNKAKGVIKDKFSQNNVKASFHSIAGLLGQKLNMETGAFERDIYDNTTTPIEYADVLIIDEASMVNEQILDLIFKMKPSKTKVIFMGDIGQLPPIRTNENSYYKNKEDLFGKKSPVFDGLNKAKLLTRVRQGEANPILPFADYFWEASQVENADLSEIPRDNVISDKGNLIFTNSFADIREQVLDSFKESVATGNPNHIKVVTYRNATRQAVNTFIHNSLFGVEGKEYSNGEIIIFNDGYGAIENATEVQIKSSSEVKIDNKNLNYIEISFEYEGSIKSVPVILKNSQKDYQNQVSAQFKKAFALKGSPQYKTELANAWALKNRYANIDYGYAITSHKSQGSTYDIVVVDEKDINSVGALSSKQKYESIYTALTRAKTTAIIVSSKKVEDSDYNIEEISNKNTEKEFKEFVGGNNTKYAITTDIQNTLSSPEYQLDNKQNINNSIEELDNYLLNFLKQFNVKSKKFEDLKYKLGVNALGATDTLNKLIWYAKNRNEETLPEEAAHMLVMLMGEKNHDINELINNISNWSEYNDIYKEYMPIYEDKDKVKIEAIGKLIAKSLVSNYKANGLDETKLEKALQAIREFTESILKALNINSVFQYNQSIADHIAINVLSGNKDYIYKITNNNSNLDAKKEIENNLLAQEVINKFSSQNVKMTGSLAIAGTENIRRPEGNGIHDIDFKVNSFSIYENEILPKIPKNAVPAHYGWHKKNYSTFAYLIPKEGYTINVKERKDDFSNGWITDYEVIDNKGNKIKATQDVVTAVDFFVYKDNQNQLDFNYDSQFIPASLVYEGKLSLSGKSNPYFFSRDKDQEDYVLRNPESFIPFEKTTFYQLNNNLTPEQNNNINDLKSIEPAYANYTNKQIQSFIESEIPGSRVKEVVFHGSNNKFDKFNDSKLPDGGLYFEKSKMTAYNYGDNLLMVLLDINPFYVSGNLNSINDAQIKENGYDSVTDGGGYKVYDKNKITILNSPETIKEFKEFVGGNNTQFQKNLEQTSIDLKPNEILPDIIKKLNQTGLSNRVVLLNNTEINEKLKEIGVNDVTMTTTGFVHNSTKTVYLNTDNPNIVNTAMHEHGHLYLNYLKENKPELYAAGLAKTQTAEAQPYIAYVKETQPNLVEGTEAFQNEVLAQVIGDMGAKLVNSKKQDGLAQWLSELWTEIKNMLGLSKYTNEQVQNMTLQQYADAIDVDMLSGKKINDLFNPLLEELARTNPAFEGIQLTETPQEPTPQTRVQTPFGLERNRRRNIFKKEFGERTADAILSKLSGSMSNEPEQLITFLKEFIPIKATMADVINTNGGYLQKMFEKKINQTEDVSKKSTLRPEDLLNKVGYRLDVKTDLGDAQKTYKSYYKDGEVICSLSLGSNRFNDSYVTFFVRDDAKETPHAKDLTQKNITERWDTYLESKGRKNADGTFDLKGLTPKSLDPYSTSVMSVQISKNSKTLKSISRYNHTLSSPDYTYKNLDNIVDELHDSFYNFFNVAQPTGTKLDIPNGYILNGKGQLFKTNGERNGVNFGEGFYIKSNGKTVILDPVTQMMGDAFLFDTKNGTVLAVTGEKELILGEVKGYNRIQFKSKNTIKLTGEFETEIEIKDGNLYKLKSNVTTIGNTFLSNSKSLVELSLPNNTTIGYNFLNNNNALTELILSNNTTIGYSFLRNNNSLTELILPNNTTIGDYFLRNNDSLVELSLPNNTTIGDDFLRNNNSLTELILSNNTTIGYSFLRNNNSLTELILPNNTTIGYNFLNNNNSLTELILSNNTTIGDDFLRNNDSLVELSLPNNTTIGDDFLYSNKTLTEESVRLGKGNTVESLRAKEQVELQQAFPLAKPINGKIKKESLTTDKDIAMFEEIYDRYDKLITPLIEKKLDRKASKKAKIINQIIEENDLVLPETTFEQVENQWFVSGRTKEDWNNMKKEDREYVIKNCL